MTIEKGREWGALATVPRDMVVATDESSLAQAVASHVHSDFTQPLAVWLTSGDLLTALGVSPGERVAPPHVGAACRLLPCDAYEATIEHTRGTTTSLAVSSVVVGSAWKPAWWFASGGFLGRLNVLPNSHPNDGRADAIAWSPIALRELMSIRRRMRLGDHLPHPHLAVARGSAVQWQSSGAARNIVIDGRSHGRARAVTVKVLSDAFCLVVSAP